MGVNRSLAGAFVHSPDASRSPVDDAGKFAAEFRRTLLEQAYFRFFSGKPGGVSIRFLRRFEARHFAKVGSDGKFWLDRSGTMPRVLFRSCVASATEVSGEGDCFYPAMNASLFKGLESGRLGVREFGFNPTFWENPTSAASLNQQEFDAAFANAITNGSDLLAALRKP